MRDVLGNLGEIVAAGSRKNQEELIRECQTLLAQAAMRTPKTNRPTAGAQRAQRALINRADDFLSIFSSLSATEEQALSFLWKSSAR
jgi:hypothetical protein